MTAIALILTGTIIGLLTACCFRDNRVDRLRLQLADALDDARSWTAAAHLHQRATDMWRQRYEDADRDARNMEAAYIRLDDATATSNVVALPGNRDKSGRFTG